MAIENNIRARDLGRLIVTLATEEAIQLSGDLAATERFWRSIGDAANAAAPPVPQLTPPRETAGSAMTDKESRRFDHKAIPFGKHMGTLVKDVPLDYLLWLDGLDDFRVDLRRYLASDRIQAEQIESDCSP